MATHSYNTPHSVVLAEPHSFNLGDNVVITHRYDNKDCYEGTIYNILNLPINKFIKPLDITLTDYFFIRLSMKSYHQIIQRGWEIIYNYKRETVGDVIRNNNGHIDKLFINSGLGVESEIDIHNINAILIWRLGYTITKSS